VSPQAPKTALARVLWETCPECYDRLEPDSNGTLVCPRGHYRAEGATTLAEPADAQLTLGVFAHD